MAESREAGAAQQKRSALGTDGIRGSRRSLMSLALMWTLLSVLPLGAAAPPPPQAPAGPDITVSPARGAPGETVVVTGVAPCDNAFLAAVRLPGDETVFSDIVQVGAAGEFGVRFSAPGDAATTGTQLSIRAWCQGQPDVVSEARFLILAPAGPPGDALPSLPARVEAGYGATQHSTGWALPLLASAVVVASAVALLARRTGRAGREQ
jgi:hypothetical protein